MAFGDTTKLKNIKSFSHNFTHSFVSYNNYVDDDFVMRDLAKFARAANGEVVSIDWLEDQPPFHGRIAKSIELWKKWIPEHLSNHELSLNCIAELRTDVWLEANYQITVRSYAKDINGKEYTNRISDFII